MSNTCNLDDLAGTRCYPDELAGTRWYLDDLAGTRWYLDELAGTRWYLDKLEFDKLFVAHVAPCKTPSLILWQLLLAMFFKYLGDVQ